MPIAKIRGANIHYACLGDKGPWVALSPGGRAAMKGVQGFAERLAAAGYRILLHDRRNCGLSDLVLTGDQSEYDIWADDLQALLTHLGIDQAIIGGNSSGCRLSVRFAVLHPQFVQALLLWRLTGGEAASRRLAQKYYGDFIDAVREGGMQAVCKNDFFVDRFTRHADERAQILQMDRDAFIASMTHWRDGFLKGIDQPIIGVTPEELNTIQVPVCIIPGNDKTHSKLNAQSVKSLLPMGELYQLIETETDQDVLPIGEWNKMEDEQLAIFLSFLARHGFHPRS
jgi:pimeloyl-ACP methyl ester carboxylesterase